MCAALSASDHGASVLLVERSPRWRRGGNSRHTRDLRYAHDQPHRWAPSPYPPAEFLADLASITDALPRPELAELLVEESQTLPDWMEGHGVHWQAPINGTLHLGTNRFFLGGGKAMMNSYYDRCADRGIDVVYETSVTALETSNGTCTAVELRDAETQRIVNTKALVVASGGLEANHAWLVDSWGEGAANFIVRGTPDNDGALLLSLIERGAASVGSNLFHCVAVDARSPRFDGGIVTRVDSIPFGIVVNTESVRFHDEGEEAWPKRYAQWGQLIAVQPEQSAFSIFDSQSWGLFIPPPYPPMQSESIAGLAEVLGLDGLAFARTVSSYNAATDASGTFDPRTTDGLRTLGLDPPKSNWARAIEEPPFYAYPLKPGLTFTYAGVGVDESARILRTDADPFENIFAAGETMAGNILNRGYLAGVGLTIGGVFGRIAGREAASA